MSNKSFYGFLAGVGLLFFAGVYGYQNGWFGGNPPPKIAINDQQESEKLVSSLEPTAEQIKEKDLVKVGGLYRQRSDVEKTTRKPKIENDDSFGKRIGQSPRIAGDSNPYIKSVVEAHKNPEKYPERLSAMIAPKPFDLEEFKKDPQKYAMRVEPGRVFQNITPKEGVKPLKRLSPLVTKVVQGETVALKAEGDPGAPITFHVFDLGNLENNLKTMTVIADEKGQATVNYKATTGTYGLMRIAAASPLNSKRVRFAVKVSLPEKSGTP